MSFIEKNSIDYEKLICSLLYNDELNFNTYNITSDMFKNEIYRNYILYLEEHRNKARTRDINAQYAKRIKNPNIFTSSLDLSKILDLMTVQDVVENFFKIGLCNAFSKKINELDSSLASQDCSYALNQTLDSMKEVVSSLRTNDDVGFPDNPFDDFLTSYYDIIESRERFYADDIPIIGIKSGFAELDSMIHGFRPGQFVVIGGRPGMGKTSFALDIAVDAIMNDKAVLIFSLEMPKKDLVARLLPKIHSSLTLNNTLLGENHETHSMTVKYAVEKLRDKSCYIVDFADKIPLTASNMLKTAEKFIRTYGQLDLVIVDYIQIMPSELRTSDENTKITDNSAKLMMASKQTNSTWIILSQLNRELEKRVNKKPTTADLRGSGSLEQDGDIILFPYREAEYIKQEIEVQMKKNPKSEILADTYHALMTNEVERAEIIVAKNRNGAVGSAPVMWYKKMASYRPFEHTEINDFKPEYGNGSDYEFE